MVRVRQRDLFIRALLWAGVILSPLFYLPSAMAACTSPTGTPGQMRYIASDYKVCETTSWTSIAAYHSETACTTAGQLKMNGAKMEFCNGSNWIDIDQQQTSGACTTLGQVQWDTGTSKLRYCNGTNWIITEGIQCPTGYIRVPPMAGYAAQPFCVAKYEMKSVSGVATSQAALTPWASVNTGGARDACTALGDRYWLVTNEQWQAIARNIESVAANWSSGIVGTGQINRGHSDNSPANSLAASTDTDACFGTGQTCSDTVWNSQRRTHVLSNGEVIWDFAGNVRERTMTYDNYGASGYGAAAYISQITDATHTGTDISGRKAKAAFGPSGNHTALGSSEDYGGLGYFFGFTNQDGIRGGSYATGIQAGIFMATGEIVWSDTSVQNGFRCATQPVPPPCMGKSIGQACDGTPALYAGSYYGKLYMVTPGGCTDSTTPTCDGTADVVLRSYGGVGSSHDASSSFFGQRNSSLKAAGVPTGAAAFCEDLVYGGYSDWFLPGRYESGLMLYPNRAALGGFGTSKYWASTESGINTAYSMNYADGVLNSSEDKAQSNKVRCVRKFPLP